MGARSHTLSPESMGMVVRRIQSAVTVKCNIAACQSLSTALTASAEACCPYLVDSSISPIKLQEDRESVGCQDPFFPQRSPPFMCLCKVVLLTSRNQWNPYRCSYLLHRARAQSLVHSLSLLMVDASLTTVQCLGEIVSAFCLVT